MIIHEELYIKTCSYVLIILAEGHTATRWPSHITEGTTSCLPPSFLMPLLGECSVVAKGLGSECPGFKSWLHLEQMKVLLTRRYLTRKMSKSLAPGDAAGTMNSSERGCQGR